MIETRLRNLLEAVLRLPLLVKLVVANTTVLVLGVGLTAWIFSTTAAWMDPSSAPALLTGTVIALVLLGVVVNAVVVHFALSPLRKLEQTATSIGQGSEDARVGTSTIADPDLGRLMGRFDEILDTLTEARERQQVAASLLVDSEERVRMRIADVLYGDVGQRLATVLLLLGRLARSTPSEPGSDASAPVLGRIQEDVTGILEDIRKTARHLRPPELDDLGVMAAIQAEVRTVDAGVAIPVTLEEGSGDLPPGEPEGLLLFRLIQEGLALVLAGQKISRAPNESDDPPNGDEVRTTRGTGSNRSRPNDTPCAAVPAPTAVTLRVTACDGSVRCDIETDQAIPTGRVATGFPTASHHIPTRTRSNGPGPELREGERPDEGHPPHHFAPWLEPLRERAAWVGGSVTVLDRRPTGTILRIEIPGSRRRTRPEEGGTRACLSA